jgi:arylformamidase
MKIYDLTMPIDENTPVFPGDAKQEIKNIATIKKDGWNEKLLTIRSHFSTHIDAPFHMIQNGKTLNDYPMEKFVGEAIIVDARGQNSIQSELECVQQNDIVLFYTGHAANAHSSDFFKNNPVLSKETASKLVEKKVKIIGIDSYTPDNAPYELHKMLFKHDILIVENLINLDKLLGKRFMCYILPLKLKDADGAPCRVIGVL